MCLTADYKTDIAQKLVWDDYICFRICIKWCDPWSMQITKDPVSLIPPFLGRLPVATGLVGKVSYNYFAIHCLQIEILVSCSVLSTHQPKHFDGHGGGDWVWFARSTRQQTSPHFCYFKVQPWAVCLTGLCCTLTSISYNMITMLNIDTVRHRLFIISYIVTIINKLLTKLKTVKR